MITIYDIFYYLIYGICLYFSFKARENNIPGLIFLRLMLCFGLFTEIIVEILQYHNLEENWPYYLYIPLEYILLLLFYTKNLRSNLLKKIAFSSTLLYLMIYSFFVFFQYHFKGYPSSIYNTSCLLNVIWLIILFFGLEFVEHLPVTSLPLFWIYTALLVFFAGIFFFNGAYNYFVQRDSDLAKDLRNYINTGLNYILYSVLTYAFVCSKNIRKY